MEEQLEEGNNEHEIENREMSTSKITSNQYQYDKKSNRNKRKSSEMSTVSLAILSEAEEDNQDDSTLFSNISSFSSIEGVGELGIVNEEWKYKDNHYYNFDYILGVKEQRRIGTPISGRNATPQAPSILVRVRGPNIPKSAAIRANLYDFGPAYDSNFKPKNPDNLNGIPLLEIRDGVEIKCVNNIATFEDEIHTGGWRYARIELSVSRGARVKCKKHHIALKLEVFDVASAELDSLLPSSSSILWVRTSRISVSEKVMCPRNSSKKKQNLSSSHPITKEKISKSDDSFNKKEIDVRNDESSPNLQIYQKEKKKSKSKSANSTESIQSPLTLSTTSKTQLQDNSQSEKKIKTESISQDPSIIRKGKRKLSPRSKDDDNKKDLKDFGLLENKKEEKGSQKNLLTNTANKSYVDPLTGELNLLNAANTLSPGTASAFTDNLAQQHILFDNNYAALANISGHQLINSNQQILESLGVSSIHSPFLMGTQSLSHMMPTQLSDQISLQNVNPISHISEKRGSFLLPLSIQSNHPYANMNLYQHTGNDTTNSLFPPGNQTASLQIPISLNRNITNKTTFNQFLKKQKTKLNLFYFPNLLHSTDTLHTIHQ